MLCQTEKILTYFLKVERVSVSLPVVGRLTMTKDAMETQENKFTKMFSQDIPKSGLSGQFVQFNLHLVC